MEHNKKKPTIYWVIPAQEGMGEVVAALLAPTPLESRDLTGAIEEAKRLGLRGAVVFYMAEV